jgi:ABC-type sulfate/molybdate transport systems ATPase subunit
VALARALVLDPALLLLDEPFGALDPGTRRVMRGLLKAALAARQVTAVCVTHSPMEALALGERIAVMERGRVVQEGMAGDLLRRPRSSVVAEFLGQPEKMARSSTSFKELSVAMCVVYWLPRLTVNAASHRRKAWERPASEERVYSAGRRSQ